MGEFAKENGKVGKGVLSAIIAGVKYLVLPVLIVSIIISLMSGISEDAFPLDNFETIRTYMIIFALPIIAIAFFVGFYPKGSYSRMTFGIAYTALICVWLWVALRGGKIDITMDFVGAGVDFTPLLLLIIFAASLKAVFFLAEAPSYREEFINRRNSTGVQQSGVAAPAVDAQQDAIPGNEPQIELAVSEAQSESASVEKQGSGPSTSVAMPRPSTPGTSNPGSEGKITNPPEGPKV